MLVVILYRDADEAASPPASADPGLYRARTLGALLHRSNVHQSELAVHHAARTRLSHALQYYRVKWMHYHDKGEISLYLIKADNVRTTF